MATKTHCCGRGADRDNSFQVTCSINWRNLDVTNQKGDVLPQFLGISINHEVEQLTNGLKPEEFIADHHADYDAPPSQSHDERERKPCDTFKPLRMPFRNLITSSTV